MSATKTNKKVRQISTTEKGWFSYNQHMGNNPDLKRGEWMEKAILNQIKADKNGTK